MAKASHYLDWCSTAPITLAIDRLQVPNTPSQSAPYYPHTLYADLYEWTLPNGWRTSDNKTGTFITSAYSISVIPAAGSGGQVKVRGYNYECSLYSSPRVDFYSNYSTLTIDREPQLAAAQGLAEVYCGDRTPITYTVASLPGATYSWSLPQGWSGSSNSTTITVTPSGSGGGNIVATATFTCTNPVKTISSTAKVVAFNPNVKPVAFTAAPAYVCPGGTIFSASSPGATSYTWSTTGGMRINGQPSPVTTSSSSATISLSGQYIQGNAQVTVVANNGSCGSSTSASKSVWMNVPAQPQPNVYGNPATINLPLGGWTQVVANSAPGSDNNYDHVYWEVANRTAPGTTVTGLAIYQKERRVTSIEALEPGYYYLMVRSWNTCGYSMYYYIVVNVTVGGGGGVYMVETYPNPANDFIDIKIKKVKATKEDKQEDNIRLVLFDSQGNIVQEAIVGEGSKRLDVRKQPEGLYYLHLYHRWGVEKKQILIKR
ncbi:T9SS type A sorting domain-containing protein [Pontibacter akesuensis]|uniref:T9SS type A sorting domain-containing protein n=1 Tax=Pontibacter akesuensis TaxID=388950 RepID=UPI0015602BCF|nr:T9SS type A sorting domain-containing protein [Pontibacter akesuensis]